LYFYRRSDLTFHVPAFQGNHIEWLAPFSLERSRVQLCCPPLTPAVLVTPLRCVPQRGPLCSRKDYNSTNGVDPTPHTNGVASTLLTNGVASTLLTNGVGRHSTLLVDGRARAQLHLWIQGSNGTRPNCAALRPTPTSFVCSFNVLSLTGLKSYWLFHLFVPYPRHVTSRPLRVIHRFTSIVPPRPYPDSRAPAIYCGPAVNTTFPLLSSSHELQTRVAEPYPVRPINSSQRSPAAPQAALPGVLS
jgi:hypothetical protein